MCKQEGELEIGGRATPVLDKLEERTSVLHRERMCGLAASSRATAWGVQGDVGMLGEQTEKEM